MHWQVKISHNWISPFGLELFALIRTDLSVHIRGVSRTPGIMCFLILSVWAHMVSHKTQDEKSVLLLYITSNPSVFSMAAAEKLLLKAPSSSKKTSFEMLFDVNHNKATGRPGKCLIQWSASSSATQWWSVWQSVIISTKRDKIRTACRITHKVWEESFVQGEYGKKMFMLAEPPLFFAFFLRSPQSRCEFCDLSDFFCLPTFDYLESFFCWWLWQLWKT